MKTMFLAAVAALLIIGGAAQAEPVGSDQLANEPQEAAALVSTPHRPLQVNQVQSENPTDLPSYEMRPDGLMINGFCRPPAGRAEALEAMPAPR
jgi:hypothetical protein